MITPEFLSTCTDDQINFGVAWLEAKKDSANSWRIPYNNMLFKGNINHQFEPCTNPNDAWPIIYDNNILIRPMFNEGKFWLAQIYQTKSYSKNPLRAAMEVYLMRGN